LRSAALGGRRGLPWSGPRPRYPAAPALRYRPGARACGRAPGFGRSAAVGGAEDQGDGPLLAVPLQGELQPVPGAVGARLDDEFLTGVDALAVHLGDDVARLDARLVAGSVGDDRGPAVGALGADPGAVAGELHVQGDADHRVGGLPGGDQFLGDALALVDRDGEAEAYRPGLAAVEFAAGTGGPDGRVDADHPRLRVEQGAAAGRAAAVPLLPAGRDGPLPGADDAGGDGAGQVEGGSDGDDGVADLHVVGVAEGQRGESADALDLHHGQVVAAVPADDGGLGGVAAVEGHGDLAAAPCGLHDVVVGEDVAAGVEREPGAGARLARAAGVQGDDAGQGPGGDPGDAVRVAVGGLLAGLRQLHAAHTAVALQVGPDETADDTAQQPEDD